jgi:hypothetical protein
VNPKKNVSAEQLPAAKSKRKDRRWQVSFLVKEEESPAIASNRKARGSQADKRNNGAQRMLALNEWCSTA